MPAAMRRVRVGRRAHLGSDDRAAAPRCRERCAGRVSGSGVEQMVRSAPAGPTRSRYAAVPSPVAKRGPLGSGSSPGGEGVREGGQFPGLVEHPDRWWCRGGQPARQGDEDGGIGGGSQHGVVGDGQGEVIGSAVSPGVPSRTVAPTDQHARPSRPCANGPAARAARSCRRSRRTRPGAGWRPWRPSSPGPGAQFDALAVGRAAGVVVAGDPGCARIEAQERGGRTSAGGHLPTVGEHAAYRWAGGDDSERARAPGAPRRLRACGWSRTVRCPSSTAAGWWRVWLVVPATLLFAVGSWLLCRRCSGLPRLFPAGANRGIPEQRRHRVLVAICVAFAVWAGTTHAEQVLHGATRRAISRRRSRSPRPARGSCRSTPTSRGSRVPELPGITLASPAFYASAGVDHPAIQPQFVIGPAATYGLGIWVGRSADSVLAAGNRRSIRAAPRSACWLPDSSVPGGEPWRRGSPQVLPDPAPLAFDLFRATVDGHPGWRLPRPEPCRQRR